MQEQRRLDRILADSYLHQLEEADADDLRGMRTECQAEEQSLSFARRILHGRLDLVRAELQRRSDGATVPLADLLAELADGPASAGPARSVSHVAVEEPDQIVLEGRRAFDLQDESVLARLGEADVAELHDAVDRWLGQEREISAARSRLHARLDAIQTALVAAYRSGNANVDDVLGGASA